uniref:IncI1 plasmid conjugative transfer protein TraW n=1 Tax=Pseudomonas syringae pv. actinidiae TaxID=103796 RepID=A0A2P0QEI8_PSESF|nr:conjugal transfer protein TraW [Pseudomonas syringae]ARO44786.1 IncI1 plasmid conjugative transfer protein TraW [Pseudomonas syringae pv. actinidiae]
MNALKFSPLAIALLTMGMFASKPAYAICDGCVVGAVETANLSITLAVNTTTAAVGAMASSVNAMLYQVGTAVTQGSSKVANTVETAARVDREFAATQEKNRRYEDARQRYYVSNSICSESASGGAVDVKAGVVAIKTTMRSGGGGKTENRKVAQALTSPAPPSDIDAMRAASIHADYCDADDYAAYGGASACPSVSQTMPGADKRLDSVLIGAGPNGKSPDLTFSQEQTDAAQMYTQNSARRSIGGQLRKGEAESEAGSQYVGLMLQYLAILNAATDPQDQLVADSQPNPATKDLLVDTLKSSSAQAYYAKTASSKAKTTGTMSAREFEAFEVGRRYANTEYQADLQNMEGDNLIREQIRVQSQTNWLLLELRNDVQRGNVINGLDLASNARSEFEPILTQKLRAVSGHMGGSK